MLKYSLLLLPLLAGCNTIQTALELADRAEKFEELEDRFKRTEETTLENIPTSGVASYTGVAAILIDEGQSSEEIIAGDARVSADFNDGTVTGVFDDFATYNGGISFTNYNGQLVMNDGVIGGANPGDIVGSVQGTLTGGGDTIVIDAQMDAAFEGNPIEGILAEDIEEESTLTVNGETGDIRFGFAVEND